MKQTLKKKLIAAAMSTCLLAAVPTAAEAAVTVTLPTFDVTLNGTTIENANRQYPLLVYNDITYVPMTYHDCRFLGLETAWNQQDGLCIDQSDVTGAYYEDTIAKKNSKRAAAQLVTGKVEVNGKQINNASEQYPLLLYRDVTYFPLTWRYAVNEFGWNYHFDTKNGLVISSTNQKTDSITIKDGRKLLEFDDVDFDFAIDAENLYYQGEKGAIYQRPLNAWNNDAKRKTIAQIPYEDNYFTGYPQAWFDEQLGNVYYTYHVGGATFGGELLYRIENGQTVSEVRPCSYDTYTDFGAFAISTDRTLIGGYPMVPMTYIAQDGTKSALGPSGYFFTVNEDSYDAKRNVLYVSAWQLEPKTEQPGKNYLYAVSLKDGSMEKLSDKSINNNSAYMVTNDALYFASERQLYRHDLNSGAETVVISDLGKWTHSVVTENGIYCGSLDAGKQLCLVNSKTGAVTTIHNKGTIRDLFEENGYVVALFTETTDNPTRILVFDANGKQVYSSADVASQAVINEDGVLVYRLTFTAQLVKVQL